MDPNATLAQLRDLVAKYDSTSVYWDAEDMTLTVDLIDALDGWLTCGGYLPDAWRKV